MTVVIQNPTMLMQIIVKVVMGKTWDVVGKPSFDAGLEAGSVQI